MAGAIERIEAALWQGEKDWRWRTLVEVDFAVDKSDECRDSVFNAHGTYTGFA
jgi:hypothetical protein